MTGLNIASRDSMKTAQVIDCASMVALDAAFQEVRAETEVLILATITDFLISGGNCGTIFSTIDPVLATFTTKLLNFCAFRPNLQVVLFDQKSFRRCFSQFPYVLSILIIWA